MCHSVIPYDVAFCQDTSDQIMIIFYKIADYKKDSRCLMLLQCIKDCRSISVFVSSIKGQINDFLVCITGIVGIVLFKIIDGGVSGRTLPLLLKA